MISAGAVATTVLLFAPLARYIPRSALAGILIVTAFKMVEWRALAYHLRASRFDAAIVLVTASIDAEIAAQQAEAERIAAEEEAARQAAEEARQAAEREAAEQAERDERGNTGRGEGRGGRGRDDD